MYTLPKHERYSNDRFGQRIRTERERLGYTRERFAELVGISTSFVNQIENGVSANTLITLSSVLGVSIDYLLFGKVSEIEDIISILQGVPPKFLPTYKAVIEALAHSLKPDY